VAAAGAVLALGAAARAADAPARRDDAAAEKLGWRLAVQCYTFRGITFYETLDRCAQLGVKYVEIWPGQRLAPDRANLKVGPALSPELRAEVKAKMAALGIKPVCIGVAGCSKETMDFAKEMGIEVIVTETKPTAELDKMLGEYGLKMALHNHPNSWPPEQVLEASKGMSNRVGACADTGHWVRRGLVPVECLKKLEGRVISLHFKDLGEKKHDVPWGTGVGDARGQLAELKRQGFRGPISIEYEHGSGEELVANLAKCVAFFDQTAADLAKAAP
jgi:sugar phosphate isomerase/epimerase